MTRVGRCLSLRNSRTSGTAPWTAHDDAVRKVKQSVVVSRIPFCSLLFLVAGCSANRSSPDRGRHRRTVGIQPKQVNISTLWTQVMEAFALRDTRMEAHRDILLSRPFLIFLFPTLLPCYLLPQLIYHLYLDLYSPGRISGRL